MFHLKCSVDGTSQLSAQCSATVFQVHSDFGSLCTHKIAINIFLFYYDKTVGQQDGGERELRLTKMVYGVKHLI